MEISPLENWIAEKIGVERLTAGALAEYQLSMLRDMVEYCKSRSRRYREKLAGFGEIGSLRDFEALPFTTPAELSDDPNGFLCVAPDQISRIVTLRTSGTAGAAKRVFFTPEDQERITDFFHRGMMAMADSGSRVMIFMPGETPGSVGDLLSKGLERFGAEPVLYGAISDYGDAAAALFSSGADVAVGMPAHLYALARLTAGKLRLKSVLLASDYISPPLIASIERAWGCKVYRHYGLTETGLGGAVDCAARRGYHMREADVYFEIVDPVTGAVLPDGQYGEIAFTTLSRRGMPLIRYRTGDRSRIIRGPCPCGSVLARLDAVGGRIAEALPLEKGGAISITQLDDILYTDPFVIAFEAELTREGGRELLVISINCVAAAPEIPALDTFPVDIRMQKKSLDYFIHGMAKRKIIDRRKGRNE